MGVSADCRLLGMGSLWKPRVRGVPELCQWCVGMCVRESDNCMYWVCARFVSPEYKVLALGEVGL